MGPEWHARRAHRVCCLQRNHFPNSNHRGHERSERLGSILGIQTSGMDFDFWGIGRELAGLPYCSIPDPGVNESRLGGHQECGYIV